MQTMNYMPGNSKNDLINDASQHKQCRFELLTGHDGSDISYRIWLGYHSQNKLLQDLEKKLCSDDYGYGIYLGQRQFRANLQIEAGYSTQDIEYLPLAEYVDSAIELSKGKPTLEENAVLQIDKMPLEQKKEETGRNPARR